MVLPPARLSAVACLLLVFLLCITATPKLDHPTPCKVVCSAFDSVRVACRASLTYCPKFQNVLKLRCFSVWQTASGLRVSGYRLPLSGLLNSSLFPLTDGLTQRETASDKGCAWRVHHPFVKERSFKMF